ncbi:uncharacterized protein [Dermacentor andersoni]|uniref:uncharacterized protein n=1 Tax=Dermacentor andersoni TaxID=34620 RepID=UPI0024177667|nr:uncharacterized protein LOC129387461 [Dermacentor andersoni]
MAAAEAGAARLPQVKEQATKQAAAGSKRNPSFAKNKLAPQEDAPASPLLGANLRPKSRSQPKEQEALALARPQPGKPAFTLPREARQQQPVQEMPGSSRSSRNQPPAMSPERQADVEQPLPDGVVAPKGPNSDRSSLGPSYLRESLDADQSTTGPCVICGAALLIAMSMGLIFFLFKSTEMVAAMERTTTTTEAQTTWPTKGRAMSEAMTFAHNRETSPRGKVPWAIDDGAASSEKELDDTEASIATTIDGDGDEARALAV